MTAPDDSTILPPDLEPSPGARSARNGKAGPSGKGDGGAPAWRRNARENGAAQAGDGRTSAEPDRSGGEPAVRVEDIVIGQPDACGEKITRIFHKRSTYAVYGVSGHIRIHFSDDDEEADRQIVTVSPLFRLRDRLEFLKQDLNCRRDYEQQIANAFRIGLQGDVAVAKAILNGAIRNATEKRARIGRIAYLIAAAAMTGGLALLLCLGSIVLISADYLPLGSLVLAAEGGALGAFLSIAMAIRTRTVAPDGHIRTNVADGALRIVIGVLAGGALHLLLTSGFISNPFEVTGSTETRVLWQAPLILGFIAGFLERLVPDLLEKREPFEETPAEKAGTTEPG